MICGGSEKGKSLIENVLEKSSYVNSLVCDIVNSACLEASNTIKYDICNCLYLIVKVYLYSIYI
jgi:hypothetical protein